MKKIISLLLAMIMIFSLATVAFAAEGEVAASEAKTFNFKKSYQTTNGEEPATFPAEKLQFEVKAVGTDDGANPDDTMITVEDQTVAGNPADLIVGIPSYAIPGKYNYTIQEIAGNTQGVDYTEAVKVVIGVQVLVTFNKDHTALESQVVFNIKEGEGDFKVNENNGKIEEIVNTYDLGDLSVQKLVTGNLADVTDEFEITVTFTAENPVLSDITCDGVGTVGKTLADGKISSNEWTNNTWTETFVLSHTDKVNFTNIPKGVQWEIVEADYTTGDKNTKNYGYEDPEYAAQTGTVAADQDVAATVTNKKDTIVDMGIDMDSAPYFVILAVAMFGMVALVSKKRYEV